MADSRHSSLRKMHLILVLVIQIDQLAQLLGVLRRQIGRLAHVRRQMEEFPRFVAARGRRGEAAAFQKVADFANLPDAFLILQEQRLVGAAPQLKDLGPVRMRHRRLARQQTAQAGAVGRADSRPVVVDAGAGIPVWRSAHTDRVRDAGEIQNRGHNVHTADHRVALHTGLHTAVDVGDDHRRADAALGHDRFGAKQRRHRDLRPAQPIGDKGTSQPDILIAVIHAAPQEEFAFRKVYGLLLRAVVRHNDKDRIRVFTAGLEGFDDSPGLQVEVFDHPGINGHLLGERALEVGDRRNLPDYVVGGRRYLFQQRPPRRVTLVMPIRHSLIAFTQHHGFGHDPQLLHPRETIGADTVPAFLKIKINQFLPNIFSRELIRFVGQGNRIVEKERGFPILCRQPRLDHLKRAVGLRARAIVIAGHAPTRNNLVVVNEGGAPPGAAFTRAPVITAAFEHAKRMVEAQVNRPCPARVVSLAVNLAFLTQVPLADMISVVARIAQQRRHGHHMLVEVTHVPRQPGLCRARIRGHCALHDAQAVKVVLHPGKNLRAAGGAGRLRVVVGQLDALSRKGINDRR